jgi:hypothetical protein
MLPLRMILALEDGECCQPLSMALLSEVELRWSAVAGAVDVAMQALWMIGARLTSATVRWTNTCTFASTSTARGFRRCPQTSQHTRPPRAPFAQAHLPAVAALDVRTAGAPHRDKLLGARLQRAPARGTCIFPHHALPVRFAQCFLGLQRTPTVGWTGPMVNRAGTGTLPIGWTGGMSNRAGTGDQTCHWRGNSQPHTPSLTCTTNRQHLHPRSSSCQLVTPCPDWPLNAEHEPGPPPTGGCSAA